MDELKRDIVPNPQSLTHTRAHHHSCIRTFTRLATTRAGCGLNEDEIRKITLC